MLKSLEPRIERAITEKLYLVDLKEVERQIVITVFGSTGNSYEVSICNQSVPFCSCPDYKNQTAKIQEQVIGFKNEMTLPICKHTLFLLLKIFKLPKNRILELHKRTFNEDYIPHALIKERYLANQDAKAPKEAIDEFKKIQTQDEVKLKPVEDDCSICCEELKVEQKLIYCENSCGKPFHKKCMTSLRKFYKKKDLPLICPLCRTNWDVKKTKKRKLEGTKVKEVDEYLNFGEITKQPTKRVYTKPKKKKKS